MPPKTLYVTDLDGTLMRNDEKLSAYTVRTINELVRQGLAFTYATARSIESARTITAGLQLTIPAITPSQGETKKFYKVVVEFAGSSK